MYNGNFQGIKNELIMKPVVNIKSGQKICIDK